MPDALALLRERSRARRSPGAAPPSRRPRDPQLSLAVVPPPESPDASFIGRCEHCDAPLKLNVREKERRVGWGYRYEVMSGRFQGHELAWSDGQHIRAACPKCERPMYLERLGGARKVDVPCDVRCLAATGSKCECGCGGANHGRWHLG